MDSKQHLILRVENLNKKFIANNYVLKNISFELQRGKVGVIIGPSGSGKSTLLNIIGTLLKPTSGRVFFKETNVWSMKEQELDRFRNRHVGFVFQFYHLIPELTVFENIILPAMVYNNNKNINTKAVELLKELGLYDKMNIRPMVLSGGEKQRVAIARALINEPELILADEPTGNLDSENTGIIKKILLDKCKKKGVGLILVTHNESLKDIADDIFYLKEGRI